MESLAEFLKKGRQGLDRSGAFLRCSRQVSPPEPKDEDKNGGRFSTLQKVNGELENNGEEPIAKQPPTNPYLKWDMPVASSSTESRMKMHSGFFRNSLSFIRLYLKQGFSVKSLLGNLIRYKELWYLHEMEVDEFFLYRLWRRELTEERYKSFIGWRRHIRSLVALNPIQYRCLTENKLIFYAFCQSHGLPTPEILGIYDPYLPNLKGFEVVKSLGELKRFLAVKRITECVLKPAEGTRGQSVLVLKFSEKEGKFHRLSGEKIDDESVSKALSEYNYRGISQSTFLIQKRLRPHPSTIELSRDVPFSYRVLTILDEKNVPRIIEIYGKCSVGDIDTDNWESGGLTIRMNDNGICYGANDKAEYRFEIMEKHPQNHFRFKGWKAPFYEEVCDLGLKLAESFHFARCVAWDIIVAEDGIFVIEGNNPWSKAQQEVYDQGLWQNIFAEEAARAINRGPQKSPWW